MSSMSFATPGMTGMTNDSRPAHMQTQQPFFSNSGQIDFKHNVQISHDWPMSSNAVGSETNTTNTTNVYLPLAHKDESIVVKLSPLPTSALDSASNYSNYDAKLQHDAFKTMTVQENSTRLARMICEKMGHANDDHTGTHYPKFSDPYKSDKFKLLVHEFIEAGKPDFHTWLQMNPERGELPSIVGSDLYAKIEAKAEKYMQGNSDHGTPASPESTTPTSTEDAGKTDTKLAARVGRLEKQQSVLNSATLNNNEVIKQKIGHMEKALQMHHSTLDKHATKFSTLRNIETTLSIHHKALDTHTSKISAMQGRKLPTQSGMALREGYAKTVSTPTNTMSLQAMHDAIARC